ncbi:cytochrome c oxidase accessory protein CcoG [Bdellovibrio sp. HCB2-146]|uniref:cytochrome c oxidase accessory protein CcoG n=1 Tax=Bdellovibrio sp. HCB2-146 TaxID=3394362 RepID=UPI0039BCEA0A
MGSVDPNLLTSVDQHGDRLNIIPAEVRGFYRRHRDWSQGVLLLIFLLLPWTTINGHQTILIDIPNREFALFGILFRAHDTPLLFFVLAILTLGLAFVTSVWGRVWCGWACPQTVFIDAVYRRIERWVEGTYIKRRALQQGPMTPEKFRKVSLKWFLFFVVSSLIAHSFMAYFVGAQELMKMTQNAPSENLTYFTLVTFFTAIILFDFAWFREQFCVIMCPYGRIQSVLLDRKSIAVVYDQERGEPRKGSADYGTRKGDCVSCNRCVQVCPTGIDIRNGLQMECITCTACIDACDEIMEKVNKPKGLIRYDTLDGKPFRFKRFRTLAYLAIIIVLGAGLTYALSTREPVHFTVLRGQGLPYSLIEDQGQKLVLNQFRLHIQNQSDDEAEYQMTLAEDLSQQGVQLLVAEPKIKLAKGESREWYFFVRVPESHFQKSNQIRTQIQVQDSKNFKTSRELILLGPKVIQ